MSTQEKQMDTKPELGPTPQEVESYRQRFKEKYRVPPTESEVRGYVQFYPEFHNKFNQGQKAK